MPRHALGIDISGDDPKWLRAQRIVSTLISFGNVAIAYYWFGWWAVGLCLVAWFAAFMTMEAEVRELLIKEKRNGWPEA